MTTCPYFDNLKFDIFVTGGTQFHLSHLLPLQLGFKDVQYISLKVKFSLLRSK